MYILKQSDKILILQYCYQERLANLFAATSTANINHNNRNTGSHIFKINNKNTVKILQKQHFDLTHIIYIA